MDVEGDTGLLLLELGEGTHHVLDRIPKLSEKVVSEGLFSIICLFRLNAYSYNLTLNCTNKHTKNETPHTAY